VHNLICCSSTPAYVTFPKEGSTQDNSRSSMPCCRPQPTKMCLACHHLIYPSLPCDNASRGLVYCNTKYFRTFSDGISERLLLQDLPDRQGFDACGARRPMLIPCLSLQTINNEGPHLAAYYDSTKYCQFSSHEILGTS